MELSRLMIAFMKQSPCPVSSGLAAAQNLSAGTTKSGGGSSPATCEDELRILQQMLNLPPTPFWKMIPITSELFQGVADGSFGAMLGVPSPPLVMGVELRVVVSWRDGEYEESFDVSRTSSSSPAWAQRPRAPSRARDRAGPRCCRGTRRAQRTVRRGKGLQNEARVHAS